MHELHFGSQVISLPELLIDNYVHDYVPASMAELSPVLVIGSLAILPLKFMHNAPAVAADTVLDTVQVPDGMCPPTEQGLLVASPLSPDP